MAEQSVKKGKKTAPEKKKTAPGKTPRGKSSAKTAAAGKTKKTARTGKAGKYTKRFLDEMTKELCSIRDHLIKDISDSIRQETDHMKFVGDFYDKASDDRERVLSLTFSERERKKLNQIEEALKRISEGTYGICEMTGEKIGEERMRVMPFARFTIEAQEDMEKSG